MLKRLIFAVFVMGLVLTLSGTAISDIGKKTVVDNRATYSNPDVDPFSDVNSARPAAPLFKRPIDDVRLGIVPAGLATAPADYYCEADYYYEEVPNVYVWGLPDAYGDDLFNQRFTVDEGVVCSLKTSWILMYGPYMTGTPDLKMYLWDDDGFGFPGNKLDSVTIPFASLPSGGFGWVSADFAYATDWIFNELEEYHIGWTPVLNTAGDTLWCASDTAGGPYSGELRSSMWDPSLNGGLGGWGFMDDIWSAGDVNFRIESERCCYELPFSDCYSQSWYDGLAFFWKSPHDAYNITDWTQRFSVSGPETLQSVDVAIYDFTGSASQNAGIAGNDDVIMTVHPDDGFGYPDLGTTLATATAVGGSYSFYPTWTNFDFSSYNLVMETDFYVAFNSSGDFSAGDYECCLSDPAGTPTMRGYCYYSGAMYGMWELWDLDGNGDGDTDFLFAANMCIDPYSVCSNVQYTTSGELYWTLPDVYNDVASAQRIRAVGEECKIGEVSFQLYDFTGNPGVDSYLSDAKISVYDEVGGYPGTEIASITVNPVDYVLAPGYTTVDFGPADVTVVGNYWIAIESMSATVDDIATLTNYTVPSGWDLGAAELWNGAWSYMYDDWTGLPIDVAFVAKSSHCCIPPNVAICENDGGWGTFAHDYARTGRSNVSVTDAWCDMTLDWDYQHPTQQSLFCHPSMYDGKVIQSFNTEYRVFNFDGTLAYALTGFPLGDNMRTTPTIDIITGLNGDNPVVFVGGGTQQSVACYDWATGALIWSRDVGTVGPTGLFGATVYTQFTVLDGNLYWTTDGGNVVAADATTGTLLPGWTTNPVNLGMDLGQWAVTDGTRLFYGGYTSSAVDGDIWALDPATGGILWQLSSAGGLQGAANVFPTEAVVGEGFQGGGAYDANKNQLFVNSRIFDGDHPSDGVLYAINVGDGSIGYAVASARTIRTSPIVDVSKVFVANYSRWLTPPIGGNLAAHNIHTGAVIWAISDADGGGYYGNPVLTCETADDPNVADLLFAGGHTGFMAVLNADDGDEIYRRRIDYGVPFNSLWNSGAVGPNGEIAFSHFYGGMHFMSKGDDRPRLEIQTYSPAVPVEFGAATSVPVTFESILTNTGCTDLTINDITTDEFCTNPYTPSFTSVRNDVLNHATTIADMLTEDQTVKAPVLRDVVGEMVNLRADRGERFLNAGSSAIPPFIQTATDPDGILFPADGALLAPGDSMDITVDINQSLINRGPQYFCMYLDTDDPDFYLNGSFGFLVDPCIQATVVGGCLIDTTFLHFGMGAANTQTVYNTGRLATGDDWADPWGFDIDGDNHAMFQNAYLYLVSQYEVGINTQAWHGGGEEDSYISLQPDPNYFDNDCHAALETGVDLGSYTTDGLTYTPIVGNMVHKSFLDSVQNFDLGGGWDWTNFSAPFDNALTMGIYVNSRTAGAVDFAPLASLTVEIFEAEERNGNAVPGWWFASTHDYDLGNDTAHMNADASTAYVFNSGTNDVAWGQIKLPFGCGSHPTANFDKLRNVRTLYGHGAWWDDIYLDSAITFCTNPPGVSGQDENGVGGGDQEAHFTLFTHDFEPNGQLSFAVVNFRQEAADAGDPANYDDLGPLCNKWVGFGRGDVNNDGLTNLADIVYLNNFVMFSGPGPIPFMHCGDVDGAAGVNGGDVAYMLDWYFGTGDCPMSDWAF